MKIIFSLILLMSAESFWIKMCHRAAEGEAAEEDESWVLMSHICFSVSRSERLRPSGPHLQRHRRRAGQQRWWRWRIITNNQSRAGGGVQRSLWSGARFERQEFNVRTSQQEGETSHAPCSYTWGGAGGAGGGGGGGGVSSAAWQEDTAGGMTMMMMMKMIKDMRWNKEREKKKKENIFHTELWTRHMTHVTWHTSHDTRHMTHVTWHMTHATWLIGFQPSAQSCCGSGSGSGWSDWLSSWSRSCRNLLCRTF